MLKENLLSILAALGEVQGNAKNAEIAVPAMNLRLVARGISASGVFPARSIREVG